ncbi:MAG: type 1 glutamine amidotransferase [Ilumatobacter sp.]|nr:type 1 glutamine amidotransferase [Ilumatobacter sp.]
MTRLGLLRMCELPGAVVEAQGSYLSVFEAFFGPVGAELVDFAVHDGDAPSSIDEVDGWVISGSPASVYDDLDWIATAEEIVRAVIAAERPLLGICFGHQLMTQALGGRVEKAIGGWGAGAHDYEVVARPHGGAELPTTLRVLAMHQDQVVAPAPDAERWLTSQFCPNAGFRYGERAWSLQPHPEFTPALVAQLCRDRRERLGDAVADTALASLDRPLDGHSVAAAAMAVAVPG